MSAFGLPPSPLLSAFHATYQYYSSQNLEISQPPPPSVWTSFMNGPLCKVKYSPQIITLPRPYLPCSLLFLLPCGLIEGIEGSPPPCRLSPPPCRLIGGGEEIPPGNTSTMAKLAWSSCRLVIIPFISSRPSAFRMMNCPMVC